MRTPNNWGKMGGKADHTLSFWTFGKAFCRYRVVDQSDAQNDHALDVYQMSSQAGTKFAMPIQPISSLVALQSRADVGEQIRDGILALSVQSERDRRRIAAPTGPSGERPASTNWISTTEAAHDVYSGAAREYSGPAHDLRLRRRDYRQRWVTHERSAAGPVMINSRFVVERSKEFASGCSRAAFIRPAADRARVS